MQMGIHKVDALQMDTHKRNRQKKKYTGCNLKTMKLLDCALIRVFAVIMLNMVFIDTLVESEGPDQTA